MRTFAPIFLTVVYLGLTGCATFEDGLAAISGKGGTIARSDQVEETAQRAARLAPSQPAPAWEALFPEEAPDFIEILDEGRLLIGAVEVGAYLGVPSFKHVYLYNARSGEKIWQAERPDLVRGQYALLTSQPLIVLAGSNASTTVLLGLDPASGVRRWRHDFKANVTYALPTAGDHIAVLSREAGSVRITAYALDAGAATWSRDLPAAKDGATAKLFAGEQDIYVFGDQLTRLRGSDGAVAWGAGIPELDGGLRCFQGVCRERIKASCTSPTRIPPCRRPLSCGGLRAGGGRQPLDTRREPPGRGHL